MMEDLVQPYTGVTGRESGYEHIQVDGREHIIAHQFVMGLDMVFSQGADVPHVDLVAVQELEEWLWLGEFLDLGLVLPLAKLTPHGVQHEFGQGALSRIISDMLRVQANPLACIVKA